MNFEKILSIIEFIQNETPENQELLDKAIGALEEVLQREQDLVDENAMNLLRERDYDNMQKYVDMSRTIASLQASMKDIFEKIGVDKSKEKKVILRKSVDKEVVEDDMEFLEDDQKRINYEEYRVDETVAHDLMTDFRYTKPAAFSLDEIRYPARMWKQMLVKTCEILNQKNNKTFEEFLEDKFMQGKTRKYFSRNEESLWNPEKIKGSNIYVETNLSANSTRDMVMKMLDKYRIPYAAFKVYLSKDLNPLHKEDIKNDDLDEDQQEFKEENLNMQEICEDYDFTLRAVLNGFVVSNLNEAVLKYRMTSNSISRSNLFEQYLYMSYITNEYKNKGIASVDKAYAYVQQHLNEKDSDKYLKANVIFNRMLQEMSDKQFLPFIKDGFCLLFSSKYYLNKIYRFVMLSLNS